MLSLGGGTGPVYTQSLLTWSSLLFLRRKMYHALSMQNRFTFDDVIHSLDISQIECKEYHFFLLYLN